MQSSIHSSPHLKELKMPDKHARLSPSASERWLRCTPSVAITEDMPESTSAYADEGTDAHALCQFKVETMLGHVIPDPRPALSYYDQEMEDCSDEYAAYIQETMEKLKESGKQPVVFTEIRLDMSKFIPECFGTCDCCIITDDVLHIVDLKYGKGVEVSADHNTQMMIYALGALEMFGSIYSTSEILMTIFQPRIGNVSTWNISVDNLISWADGYLKPRALLASRGEGEQVAGEHCRFCKAKGSCRARADLNMELAAYDFKEPPLLSNSEVGEILSRLDELTAWTNDIRGYAFSAISRGEEIHGWKLVEGRSNRKYTDEEKVAAAVQEAGLDPYEHSVKGITAMTSMLGKKKFNELLGALVIKPNGKPTLAPESDKRPAIEIDDFNDEE